MIKKIIDEISTATVILSAYIEKDYYIVELLKIIAGFQTETFDVVFTGGTSLSKGFEAIRLPPKVCGMKKPFFLF